MYLLGAGGMGMSPLGLFLFEKGYQVFGWDDYIEEERKNKLYWIKWTEVIPVDCDCLIYSSAILEEHPIYKLAKNSIPCFKRGEFIKNLLSEQKLCVISGSHGKSTITAYLIHFFKTYQIPVNYLLGAEFQNDNYLPSHFNIDAQWTLLELDESDGTIELFAPHVAIILDIDWDHPTFYKTSAAYKNAFEGLAYRTKDWVLSLESLSTNTARNETLEYQSDSSLKAQNKIIATRAFEYLTGIVVSEKVIDAFPGLKRRQEVLLKTKRLVVLSDYAHHPKELCTLLSYLKRQFACEIFLAFEPHRISRLNCFYDEFLKVLRDIQNLYIGSIYKAFEKQQDEPKQDLLEHLIQAQPLGQLLPEDFIEKKEPCVVAFVGAGMIDAFAHQWMERWIEKIKLCLEQSGEQINTLVTLKHASFLRIGGTALFECTPKSLNGLENLIKICDRIGLEWTVLGLGSNMLIPEQRYDGLVIRLSAACWKCFESISSDTCNVGAGMILGNLLNKLEMLSIGGFEFLDGIPGTLGGALAMNAGTGSNGILDRVEEVTFLNKKGKLICLKREALKYKYRECKQLQNVIILSAILRGNMCPIDIIKSLRKELREKRRHSQPLGRSLGCFFKNPEGQTAGRLLDQLGCKNLKKGDIYVSPKHANFFINKGNGTYEDVIYLVKLLRGIVWERVAITLEPEVKILGTTWKQVL